MKKFITVFAALAIVFLFKADKVSANPPVANASAQLVANVADHGFDYRVARLREFLKSHNSPLEVHAEDFIVMADKYELDWRLVPAITGVESTFGKRIPYASYNAYGWANGAYKFSSWEESIEVVSKALREKYIDRGATSLNLIARRYAPPSSTWSFNVRFFMRKIEPLPVDFSLDG